MAGPVLNPTSLSSERPGLSDSQSGAQGSHRLGKGGDDDGATTGGMRAMMPDAVSGAVVGKERQCCCPPGTGRVQWWQ